MIKRNQGFVKHGQRHSLLALAVASALGVLASATAIAEEQVAAQSEGAGLNEVIVTARRRAENMQTVPVAVSSISALQLERSFAMDTTSLAQFAPNVVLDKVEAGTAGGAAFSIRGISYQDVEKAFDPTVLLFVDDIAVGTGTGNVMNMLDVQNIEVLRGPQGTLFGKNAVGGIVNIHRREPELHDVFGKVRATVGNFDTKSLEGYVNFGGENFALKFTAAELDHGGYYKNATLGTRQDDRKEQDYGMHWLWKPSKALKLELQTNHVDQRGTPNPILNISDRAATNGSGDAFCAFYAQCATNPYKSQSGDPQVAVGEGPTRLTLNSDMNIAKVNYDLDDKYRLTYIGGHMKSYDFTQFDFDGTPLPLYSAAKDSWYTQRSHELRISRNDPVLSGQAGVYYWDADSFTVNNGPGLVDRASASSKSYSIYGESDYRFANEYVLTTGARHISEKKEIGKFVDDGQGNASIPDGTHFSRTDSANIWRLGLRRELASGDMVYGTYSTGFRSGGFSPRAATISALEHGQAPEKLTNFEFGAKTRWFDKRLQLNAALFHMIYDNMQIETSLPAPGGNGQQQGFDNVGKAIINGGELELLARPDNHWTLSGNLGLTDSHYASFFTDLYGTGVKQDFTNLKLRRAPRVTYALAADYRDAFGAGRMNYHVGYNWRSNYEGTLDNAPGTRVEAFGILDASVSYEQGAWSVALFGRNLTNEAAYSHTFSVVPNNLGGSIWKFATPRTPRNYGLQVTYHFE